MINSVQVNQNEKTKKPKKIKNKGFMRGNLAATAVSIPTSIASIGLIKGMRKASKISKGDSIELAKATQEALKQSGLAEKGVKVFKINEMSFKDIMKLGPFEGMYQKGDRKALRAFGEEVLSQHKWLKNIIGDEIQDPKMLENLGHLTGLQFKIGANACYLPKANKIVTPSKHLQTSVFHEMGHALNSTGKGILKGMQKIRPLAMIAPAVILTVSLLNKRKVDDETSAKDSKLQKAKDFVKRNAGKLTALAFAPMVIEEGMASLKGQKLAKNLVKDGKLSKELLKKVRGTNAIGFASYVLTAATAVISAKVAIKVKDKIQAKYEAKQLAMQAHQG